MNRIEIELKLNRDRAWLLETYAMLPLDDLLRGVTPSEHDKSTMWTTKDHLAHLAGIEFNFVRMVRRYLGGEANPVGLRTDATGAPRTMEQVMATVHRDDGVVDRRTSRQAAVGCGGVGAAGARRDAGAARGPHGPAAVEKLPGAPWADGTIGGVLATNADHGRMHWHWVKEGMAKVGMTPPR